MIVCLEGPENAGKSTLADQLSRVLSWPVQGSEGPSRSTAEINARVRKYCIVNPEPMIYDRHPCVSNFIYNSAFGKFHPISLVWQRAFWNSRPFIVYCCPAKLTYDRATQTGPTDTSAYLDELERNLGKVVDYYKEYFEANPPHFVYDWTNFNELVSAINAYK